MEDLDRFLQQERSSVLEERSRLKLKTPPTPLPKEGNSEQNGAKEGEREEVLDLSGTTFSFFELEEAENENTSCLSKFTKEWANANQQEVTIAGGQEKEEVMSQRERENRRHDQDDMEQWVSDTFYSYFPGFNNEYQKRQHYLRERQRENQQNLLRIQKLNLPADLNAAHSSISSTSNTTTTSTVTATHPNNKTDLEIIVNNPNYAPPKHFNSAARPGSTRHKLLQDLHHTALTHIISGGGGDVDRIGMLDHSHEHRDAEFESKRKRDYQRELMQQIEEKRRSLEALREKERREDEALTNRLQEQLETMKLKEALGKEKLRIEKIRFDTEQKRLMRAHLLAKLEDDKKLLKFDVHSSERDTINKENANDAIDGDNNKVYKYFSNSALHEYRRGQPMPSEVELELEIPQNLILPSSSHIERECFHMSEKICPLCDAPLRNYESCCLRCQRKLSLRMKLRQKHQTEDAIGAGDEKPSDTTEQNEADSDIKDKEATEKTNEEAVAEHSFAMICVKCERLYTLCPTCLAKSDVCRACHRERNVCMNCRRTLCSFCLEEISRGKDTERTHVNDFDADGDGVVDCDSGGVAKHMRYKQLRATGDSDSDSEHSFRVLERRCAAAKANETVEAKLEADDEHTSKHIHNKNMNSYKHIHNDLHDHGDAHFHPQQHPQYHPPYSVNIERDSIFHPDYQPSIVELQQRAVYSNSFEQLLQLPKIPDKKLSFHLDSLEAAANPKIIERVRRETDKRLSRYLKNYGDLAQHGTSSSSSPHDKSDLRNRGTQTTPESKSRRDVVLREEHNLSMPLLREMPKMTRALDGKCGAKAQEHTLMNNQRKIDNLKRRWEIPAVQKYTITGMGISPKVLTQVGAIRKQLQTERLLVDDDFHD